MRLAVDTRLAYKGIKLRKHHFVYENLTGHSSVTDHKTGFKLKLLGATSNTTM